MCEVCGGRLRKLFNTIGVTFNGSGFYRTDSRADGAEVEVGCRGRRLLVERVVVGGSSSSGSSGGSSRLVGLGSSGSARRRLLVGRLRFDRIGVLR